LLTKRDHSHHLEPENNIILIGMTGAGKTTVSQAFSKRYHYKYVDTDLLITEKEGASPVEIVKKFGATYFMRVQDEVVLNLKGDKMVLSTGGSVVKSEETMKWLKHFGKIFYLKVDYKVLETRLDTARPLSREPNQSFYDLYKERETLFRYYADDVCDCGLKTPEEIAQEIWSKWKG
jgi:shikimate kinase